MNQTQMMLLKRVQNYQRETTWNFEISGKPMLVPDALEISETDLDSEDSGRDESGFMHRHCIRERVKTWSFTYKVLTYAEYEYMQALFRGKPTFYFRIMETKPVSPNYMNGTYTAYCSKVSAGVYDINFNVFRDYKFNIIEC